MTVNDIVLRPRPVVLDVWRAVLRVIVRIQIDRIAADLLIGHTIHQSLGRIGDRRIPVVRLRDRIKFRLDPLGADDARLPCKTAGVDLVIAAVAHRGRKGDPLADNIPGAVTIDILTDILSRARVRCPAHQRIPRIARPPGKGYHAVAETRHVDVSVVNLMKRPGRHRHNLARGNGARCRLGKLRRRPADHREIIQAVSRQLDGIGDSLRRHHAAGISDVLIIILRRFNGIIKGQAFCRTARTRDVHIRRTAHDMISRLEDMGVAIVLLINTILQAELHIR